MKYDRREFLSCGMMAPLAFSQPEALLESINEPVPKGRLALVVGHTKLFPGAYGIGALAKYEYYFNNILAGEIIGIANKRGIKAKTFLRDIGGVKTAYNNAMKWGADAVVELHFNSTRRRIDKIRGTEMLSAGGSKVGSFQLAQALQKTHLKVLERPDSQNRGVKTLRLRKRYAVPAVLTEPVFGNNISDARLLAERRGKVAEATVDGFIEFQKLKLRPQDQRPKPNSA